MIIIPYIITTTWFPTHKVPEVVKKYLEVLKKFPPDDSLGESVVPNAINTNKRGVISTGIFKVKEGRLEEALTRSRNSMALYQSLDEFEYKIKIWYTIEEAMAAIGQKMPD